MKLRNIRARQWERYITIQVRHRSGEHFIASRGMCKHYNRLANRRATRAVATTSAV